VKKFKTFFYTTLGHVFVVIGGIGVIAPVLPTTPFIILAFSCYIRGSMRFRKMLLRNKTSRLLIKDWVRYGAIPLRAKIIALIMIVISMSWSMYVVPLVLVRTALVIIGISVSLYILTRPSKKDEKEKSSF